MLAPPAGFLDLVYRDQLFPRQAYARTFETLLAHQPQRTACKTMVALLALAHDRACEAELAEQLTAGLDRGDLPDIKALQALFGPGPDAIPTIATVAFMPLSAYEVHNPPVAGGAVVHVAIKHGDADGGALDERAQASSLPVTRQGRSSATKPYRQLSGWNPPPLVNRAFGAH